MTGKGKLMPYSCHSWFVFRLLWAYVLIIICVVVILVFLVFQRFWDGRF